MKAERNLKDLSINGTRIVSNEKQHTCWIHLTIHRDKQRATLKLVTNLDFP